MNSFKDRLYQFIFAYQQAHAASPSFKEMTVAMGISPRSKSLISRNLRQLEKDHKIRLTKEGRRLLIHICAKGLPLLGRISAGQPIEALPDPNYLDLPTLIPSENRYALHVKGDSMIEEGIKDGDFIICRHAAEATEGDIIVALIDQHAVTLKRISYRLKNKITLIPANSQLKPQFYPPERIQIQGIYVGLLRLHEVAAVWQ